MLKTNQMHTTFVILLGTFISYVKSAM